MRKINKIFVLMIFITLFCSCSSVKKYNVYESLYNCYKNMHSFKAEVKVTAFSNNSQNKYTLIQMYKSPDKSRSEYVTESGNKNITIIDGEVGKITSEYAGESVMLNQIDIDEKDYLMLNTFFDIYYSSEETSVKTSGGNNNGKVLLTANTGSSNPYRQKVELLVDSESLNPIELKIFDVNGKIRLKVEYISFELNPTLSDDIFK